MIRYVNDEDRKAELNPEGPEHTRRLRYRVRQHIPKYLEELLCRVQAA